VNSPAKALAGLKVHSLPASVLIRAAALVCLLGAGTALVGQDKNPFAGNAEAAKRGEFHFRINCAFCHGLGARGGGRGPDLRRAQKRHGNSDAELFTTINQGVPGTAMPPNGTTGQGVGMTEEEVWDVITYIRSVQLKAPAQAAGDSAHGKQLFYGDANCSGCHMVEGKGGRLGPDLTAVGMARAADAIVDSVRNPSRRLAPGLLEATKEFPQEYETVTVVTARGQEIKGVTMNEDNFSLQVMDASEQIHLFEKAKLRSIKKSRTSMMPIYGATLLSDKELQDIVAYLQSVGGK
jgi:cytochrome c oxidase cbb3-type subunit 3